MEEEALHIIVDFCVESTQKLVYVLSYFQKISGFIPKITDKKRNKQYKFRNKKKERKEEEVWKDFKR